MGAVCGGAYEFVLILEYTSGHDTWALAKFTLIDLARNSRGPSVASSARESNTHERANAHHHRRERAYRDAPVPPPGNGAGGEAKSARTKV